MFDEGKQVDVNDVVDLLGMPRDAEDAASVQLAWTYDRVRVLASGILCKTSTSVPVRRRGLSC